LAFSLGFLTGPGIHAVAAFDPMIIA